MADMGLDFKAPPKADVEAWQVMQALHAEGFTFHGCGCDAGIPRPPRILSEVPAWLNKHRKRNKGERLLARFEARSG